jgi:anthranilate phosphoribosyltransferase
MQSSPQLLEHLLQRRDLTEADAERLLVHMASPEFPAAMSGALLAALRAKGETAAEVRGFAHAMRGLSRKPNLPEGLDAIDIVGTGGDASGSLNLSTGAALLTAACGMPVVKHGNRSISSRSGSADLMEALGFVPPLDEIGASQCFEATGFAFLFAPYFHPAMKALAPIRAALGVRTLFNLLGPLTNPAAPRFLLVGAHSAATAQLLAGTLAGMPLSRAWVVHGAAGWDEATPIGPFLVYEVFEGATVRRELDPRDFGIERCEAQALAGGDAAANLEALFQVFDGIDHGAHRAALLLQAGMALTIAGRVASIGAGIALARDAIESGGARAWLRRLQRFAANRAVAVTDPPRDEARAGETVAAEARSARTSA